MKKIVLIVLLIVLAVILFVGGFYFLSGDSMEKDFDKIIKEEISVREQNGVLLTVNKSELIELSETGAQAYVIFDCEGEVPYEVQEELAQSIGQKMMGVQEEKYPQIEEFRIDIYVCGTGGWVASDGYVGLKVL